MQVCGCWCRRLGLCREREKDCGENRDSEENPEEATHAFILAEKGTRAYLQEMLQQEFTGKSVSGLLSVIRPSRISRGFLVGRHHTLAALRYGTQEVAAE